MNQYRCRVDSGFWEDEAGITSEVFKIALAVIVSAAILGVMASLFGGLWPATQEATNTTSTALVDMSLKVKDRVSSF